jgi:predicted metal-dependent hydrolase
MSQLLLFEREPLTLERIHRLFLQTYRELRLYRPRPPLFHIEFYSFVGINHTIRFRNGELFVRLSDLFQEAPAEVIRALSVILLSKLFRRKIPLGIASTYRGFVNSVEMKEKSLEARSQRGRKLLLPPQGKHYDLKSLFNKLNEEYFGGRSIDVNLGWSLKRSRQILGHFDPSHNSITISRSFDDSRIPESVISYVLYHEMLHAQFSTSSNFDLKNRHSRQFKKEERKFRSYQEANDWIKKGL